jgi:beta-lactamase class A
MKKPLIVLLSLTFVCFFHAQIRAQKNKIVKDKPAQNFAKKSYETITAAPSDELQTILSSAVSETIDSYKAKKIDSGNIAATLIDLRDAKNPKMANVRGEEKIYPASVVKLFYMVALQQMLADGKVKLTTELQRGLHDMIVNSSNEATQYILDVLTDTSSGGEMPQKEFELWSYKRNSVNRYFENLGYTQINVNQKTFCEDAYGREQQFRNYKGENRNMLNTNATARLLAEIALGKAVNAERSKMMLDLLSRDPFAETKDADDQAHGFTGMALANKNMTTAKLWSKAGWTSSTRHDAAYIETADGQKFVLVIFTEKLADERDIIPTIAGKILDKMKNIK